MTLNSERYDGCVNEGHSKEDSEPTITNDKGGRQSDIKFDYTLLPGDALEHIAECLTAGCAKYGKDNWRLIPRRDHVSHAIRHLLLWCVHQNFVDLRNAATRLLFALATYDNDIDTHKQYGG